MANEVEKLQKEKQSLVKLMARAITREPLAKEGPERDKVVKDILNYKNKIHKINEQLTQLQPPTSSNIIEFPNNKKR